MRMVFLKILIILIMQSKGHSFEFIISLIYEHLKIFFILTKTFKRLMEELEESETIELEKVLLNSSRSFWENHESKNKNQNQSSSKVDYSETVKEIYLLIIFCLFDNFGINIQAKKADKNIIGIYHSEKLNNFFSKADEL